MSTFTFDESGRTRESVRLHRPRRGGAAEQVAHPRIAGL